jgi:PAS domain S-box-containing protein
MKRFETKKNRSTHLFTLNFVGDKKAFETEFKTSYFDNNLAHFRHCIVYSVLLYAVLALLDYAIFHEHLAPLLSIRFLVIIPIFLFGLIYTFNKNYRHVWRLANNFFVVMTSTGFIAMMIICRPPMNYNFYVGVIICLIFGYTFIRSFFIDASAAGLIVLIVYMTASLSINTPFDIFIHNFTYIFIINCLGMIICYTAESSVRREFILSKMLEFEKKNVETANLSLEQNVRERTQELLNKSELLKKEIEERKKSESSFKSIFQTAPNLITSVDNQGMIVDCNDRIETYLGYTPREIIGSTMAKIIHPEHMDRAQQALQEILKSGFSYDKEYKMVRKDGGYIDVSIDSSGLKDENGKYIRTICVITDISEKKKSRAEYKRLFTAIEQSAECIEITDADANIVYVNPAFEKLTGYAKEEIIGKNPRILSSGRHDESFYKDMWQTLLSKQVWKGRLINQAKDGSIFYEDVSITTVLDDNDAIMNFVAVKKDVTTQLAIEKRHRQSNKMEAIGTLAGGIAHDFNNILYPIIGFTEMSIDELPADHPVQENLEDILQGGRRAASLVKQILMFSRQKDAVKMPLLIQPVITEALKLLRATIPSNIEFIQQISAGKDYILGNPTEMHEIIINLCTNACHAMEDTGGTITIGLDKTPPDSDLNLSDEMYLCLSLTDTGHGIPSEIIDKIFDPYFSTKKQGKGSGLGLSVVHGIVKNAKGDIKVDSIPGRGTAFKIYFPITTQTDDIKDEKPPDEIESGCEKILFVDDEKPILKLGDQILRKLGYDVVRVQSSLDALALFEKNPNKFDLVITDMTMPKMLGTELAEKMLAIQPDIPIIICTGFSHMLDTEKAVEMGIKGFINKPILADDLARKVRSVLDNKEDISDTLKPL